MHKHKERYQRYESYRTDRYSIRLNRLEYIKKPLTEAKGF